jgi:ArsR family transcriptional regulator
MQDIISLFKALSDETRLRILKLLEGGELCVCDITDSLRISQPNVSFHLSLLKEAGLIRDRKDGRWMYYSLNASDTFKRFLLMGVLERIDKELVGVGKRAINVKQGKGEVC